jgi:LysR family glycine cleavage system transcriptional activator
MKRSLPSLAAVRAFEAAARHLNFTRAAAELGMTQAAVSYQVRQLEERVGATLFRRLPRRVALTEAGARLSLVVTDAFDRLAAGFAILRDDQPEVLSISAALTFATKWLAPRLGLIQIAHPEIAIRLESSDEPADFAGDEIDVGIRSGLGQWPGLLADLLLRQELTPLISPTLLERAGNLREPHALLKLPLLWQSSEDWAAWFARSGVAVGEPPEPVRASFEGQHRLGDAAIAGQGAALLNPFFFAEELQTGHLVRPFALSIERPEGYYLVYPERRRNAAKLTAFRNWLLAEMGFARTD